MDDPGDNPRKRAAALKAQPKPRHTSTAVAPALRYRSQPRLKNQGLWPTRRGSCISSGFLGDEFAAIMKGGIYGNAGAGNAAPGETGGGQS